MDVGGGGGRGLIVTLEAVDGDVVADGVLIGVDAELEQTSAALETACGLVGGADDLTGRGDDLVGGGEHEGTLGVLGLAAGGKALAVGNGRSLGQSGEGENSEGLHLDGCVGF